MPGIQMPLHVMSQAQILHFCYFGDLNVTFLCRLMMMFARGLKSGSFIVVLSSTATFAYQSNCFGIKMYTEIKI